MRYVQAIPLYTREDTAAHAYFAAHQKDLDAISGAALTIVMAETILQDGAIDLAAMLERQDRFPGLTRADVPCLWLEAAGEHRIVRLPNTQEGIVRLLRRMTDAVLAASSLKDLEDAVTDKPQPPVNDQTARFTFGVTLAVLVGLIGLLVWQLPRLHSSDLGPLKYVIYVLAALVSAYVLFRFLDSTAEVTGHVWGLGIRLGGAAALFLLVLLGGIHYGPDPPPSQSASQLPYSLKLYIRRQDDVPVRANGSIRLDLDAPVTIPINDGYATRVLDASNRNQEVKYVLDLTGYQPVKASSIMLTDAPVTIHVKTWPPSNGGGVPSLSSVVDFRNLVLDPSLTVSAFPYLRERGLLITAKEPPESEVVLRNNRDLYEGAAVYPTVSQNFLTQQKQTAAAFFTVSLGSACRKVEVMRPRLMAVSKSGVTHPRWELTALNAKGEEIGHTGEDFISSYDDVPLATLAVIAPEGDAITALRIASDPRQDGVNTAAFNGVLIEQLKFTPATPRPAPPPIANRSGQPSVPPVVPVVAVPDRDRAPGCICKRSGTLGSCICSTPGMFRWRRPANVTGVTLIACGGGGGGGQAGGSGHGGNDNAGGGGGGEGAPIYSVRLTQLLEDQYPIVVGAGGAGGVNIHGGQPGVDGTPSLFGSENGAPFRIAQDDPASPPTVKAASLLRFAGGSGGGGGRFGFQGGAPGAGGAGGVGADGGNGHGPVTSYSQRSEDGKSSGYAVGGRGAINCAISDASGGSGGGGGGGYENGGDGGCGGDAGGARPGSNGGKGAGGGGGGGFGSDARPGSQGGNGGNGYVVILWGSQ
jgi:hypothetical protein